MARFLHTPTASSPCPSPPDCLSAVVYTHACTHTHTHTHTHGNEHFALTANAHLINLVQRAGLLIPVLTHQMICQRLLGPRLLLNLSNLPQATKADTKVQLFAMATTNPRTPAPARGAVFSVRAASSPQGGIAGAVSAPPSQAMLACCKRIPASRHDSAPHPPRSRALTVLCGVSSCRCGHLRGSQGGVGGGQTGVQEECHAQECHVQTTPISTHKRGCTSVSWRQQPAQSFELLCGPVAALEHHTCEANSPINIWDREGAFEESLRQQE
jgi:hypothetical protein